MRQVIGKRKPPRPVCVLAWSLAEGDVFPGGEMVVLVERQPAAGVLEVLSDDGTRRRLGHDDRVVVIRRLVWRVPRFVAGLGPQEIVTVRAAGRGAGRPGAVVTPRVVGLNGGVGR
jgi:hypothetical protein